MAIGGIQVAIAAGAGSSDPVVAGDGAWSLSGFPAQGMADRTAGVEFRVSTVGYTNVAVRFDVRLTNAKVDLVAEGFDLAIRAAPGRLADSTLTARWLCRPSVGFYAAPSYLARRGEPREVGDPAHEWVVFGPLRGLLKAPPSFAPEPARPTMCSEPMFDAKIDAPMTHQPRFRPARK